MEKHLPKTVSSYLGSLLSVLHKPQRKHFLVYLIGLIWILKFRSIQEIAKEFGNARTDNLHHFIKDSTKKTTRLEEENQRFMAQSVDPQQTILILDDTPCPRNGKKIEGIGLHHSSTLGLVRGLCAVTAILKTGSQSLVWAIRGYASKKTAASGTFKSKVQLAGEILGEAIHAFPKGLTVVMDAWYACAPILNPLIEAGWTFLAAVRSNRVLIINGQKTCASHLAKGPRKYTTVRLSKKKRFKVAKLVVYLPQIGPALLFITKGPNGIRFFVTHNLDMTEFEMVNLYRQRFMIEVFHKDIKQLLGFREVFMRSWQGVQTHWTLVAIAYNIVALWNASQSRSFRKMICHFRDSFSHNLILNLPIQLGLTP